MKKTITDCCALCQISGVNNATSLYELELKLGILTSEMVKNTEVGGNSGLGQTSVFVVTSPGEEVLEYNLKRTGFKKVNTFERRKGYPIGVLKMYIKNL
jgi:hypothetical protein